MEKSLQLGENYPIHAYLSYRCKIDRDTAARDKLEKLCTKYNITLIFDQNATEEGDSLSEFMEDLTSARCVFLFLSPEYFQSAYTLYELVRINEWDELNRSFILPLRLSESMVTYQWTSTKDYYDNNLAIRNELTRLLKVTNDAHDQVWQRINAAWEAIIFPNLDILSKSLQSDVDNIVLDKLLGETKAAVEKEINHSTENLYKTLKQNITTILNRKTINVDEVGKELELSDNNDIGEISLELVTKTHVSDAIAIVTRVVEEQKNTLETKEWKGCIHDAVQLGGWLLINSVDPIWWFHQEIKLEKTAETSISGNFPLNDPNYIEVIISRSLLQSARYTLDKNNLAKPAGKKYDVMLFDAQFDEAKKESLLTDIYKDLYGVSPSKDVDILAKIVSRAKTHHKILKGKLIYYLVSQKFIETLESTGWYEGAKKQLAGYLQFICCDKSTRVHERQASVEDQSDLLDQIAYLVRVYK